MLNEQIKRIQNLMLIKEQMDGDLGSYLDSTYLKTPEQAGIGEEETDTIVFNTIQDAIDHNMKLVMIRPEYVESARKFIDDKGANVLVGTVIGFPNGDNSLGEKFDEAIQAIENGVDELDYVVNYKAFKKGDLDTIRYEVSEGTSIGISAGKSVKWIIESAALSDEEISNLTSLIRDVVVQTVGPEKANNVFVKTSTGFYKAEDDRPIGATPEAVSIMKSNSGPLQVKASGGIYSKEDAQKMIDAGATRLGTSAAKDIMKGNKIEKTDY
jgi:deoxyribose-phosphate aldolase